MSTLPVELQPAGPYRPSWVDRFSDWILGRPVPAWALYLALGVGWVLVAWLVVQASGVPATRTMLLYYALSGVGQAYLLGLIHYLDRSALAALERFRPVMTVDEAGFDRLRYQLTTLPARPAWIAFGLGATYAVATLLLNAATGPSPERETSPPPVIGLYVVHSVLVSGLAALLAFHTIHQLRTVSLIYTEHTRINLFQLGPLYALSNLAARTAIGISLPTYLWYWLSASAPSGLSLSEVLPAVFFGLIIVVTFIGPLLGAHQLLEREKQRLLDDVARRIEITMAALHRLIDTGQLDDQRAVLKTTLDGLVVEQGVIHRLPTWPWRTQTVSSVGATFLLPMIIWVIQRLLQRWGI